MKQELSQTVEARSASFSISAISSHLETLGYPLQSIQSMQKCGLDSGQTIIKTCGCGNSLINLKHHCNLRTCPTCSKMRKRRIRRRYMPYLTPKFNNKTDFFYFLTISPQNYEGPEGLEKIRKDFSKFVRLKYVKERVKAGIWVIECKTKNKFGDSKGWNVHIHCICYGRYLDNKIRGKCLECGQSYIKGQQGGGKYYCANRRCNSTNVVIKTKSKLVELWENSSKRKANIQITRMTNPSFTLNYMLKYVGANKDDFDTPEEMAQYIVATRKRKLINLFGEFAKEGYKPPKKIDCYCNKCMEKIDFTFDYDAVDIIREHLRNPRKKNLYNYEPSGGAIVSAK